MEEKEASFHFLFPTTVLWKELFKLKCKKYLYVKCKAKYNNTCIHYLYKIYMDHMFFMYQTKSLDNAISYTED